MIFDSVFIQRVMKSFCICPQAILIPNVQGNRAIATQTADVLVQKRERSIGCPFCKNIWLRRAIFRWQVEIERRIFWIWGPCGCSCERGTRKKGRFAESAGTLTASRLLTRSAFAGAGRADRQHGLMMYKLPKTSECFMPIRVAPYPPIEWPTRPRLSRLGRVRKCASM